MIISKEQEECNMLVDYPDILTTKDVCELLKVSKHTVYQLISAKELKAKKIARQYRIQKAELIDYLNKI